jgi:hypothetical protein
MKRCIGFFFVAAAAVMTAVADERALEIIRKVDETQMVDTSASETLMRTYPNEKSAKDFREFRVTGYGRGTDDSYMEFVEPKAIKGLKVLTLADDTWLFFPSTGRVRKIAGKSKGESVQGVGGDFSYEDLGGGTFEAKYDFTILNEDSRSWTLEGIAKKKESVYTKIVLHASKENYLPMKIEYFTEKDGHQKTLVLSDVKKIDGRDTATVMAMTNHKKRSKTVVRTLKIAYSVPVADKLFNPTQFDK